MAVLKESIFRHLSHSNSKAAAAQLLFYRGITSKLFVKDVQGEFSPQSALISSCANLRRQIRLSFSTTEEKLGEAFSQFGQLVETKIVMSKTQSKSKGYGYVTFSSEEEANKALIDMNGKSLDGRIIFVDNARPERQSRRGTRQPPEQAAEG